MKLNCFVVYLDYYQGVPVYTPSRECAMGGGICVQEGDCEKGELAQKSGICPDREMGVECCYKGKSNFVNEKKNQQNFTFPLRRKNSLKTLWKIILNRMSFDFCGFSFDFWVKIFFYKEFKK